MRGIQIGTKHTYNDWGLKLTNIVNTLPLVKTTYIDVPFANGSIDLTEAFNKDVTYQNRKLSFSFDTNLDWKRRHLLIEQMASYVHGQKHKIWLPDDPNYYYIGRLNIGEYNNETTLAEISVEAICDPYRYKNEKTIIEFTFLSQLETSTLVIGCQNSRKRVIPTITISAETRIKFQDKNYVLGAGVYTLTNIIFSEGENVIEATGVGGATIKIEYQEGAL
ncbi:MAG: hypothetical protein ACRDCZ_07190 [Culicoidibacterales bacterium]